MRAVDFFRKRPSAVYKVRYEREDGHYREITVSTGWGRFKWGSKDDALELAERRHSEQYGSEAQKRGDTPASILSERPEMHADNYTLVSVTRRPRRRR